jgi:hypothetical protein
VQVFGCIDVQEHSFFKSRPRQFVFFYDPNGIKIELNYDAAEAEGIAPELMASDLMKAR